MALAAKASARASTSCKRCFMLFLCLVSNQSNGINVQFMSLVVVPDGEGSSTTKKDRSSMQPSSVLSLISKGSNQRAKQEEFFTSCFSKHLVIGTQINFRLCAIPFSPLSIL